MGVTNINIFFLSYCPKQSAKWMVDKHVVKMILESAQLLSTAHRVLDGKLVEGKTKTGRKKKVYEFSDNRNDMYAATHINHPCAIWTRESSVNYLWLYDHFCALLEEYHFRYNKVHACEKMRFLLSHIPKNIPKTNEMTPIKCAMDASYIISDDAIENYRNYYKTGKTHLMSWKRRLPPVWFTSAWQAEKSIAV